MHARVTQFQILPEQLPQFLAAMEAAIPHARQQRGFRGLLALRSSASASSIDVRVMSLWNSLEDLQAGEQSFYFYQALAKVMAASKGFPLIESQEVLFADFGSAGREP
jgi:heme-degrading monooxygenase HmoA